MFPKINRLSNSDDWQMTILLSSYSSAFTDITTYFYLVSYKLFQLIEYKKFLIFAVLVWRLPTFKIYIHLTHHSALQKVSSIFLYY